MPTVSIVIRTLNEARYLGDLLEMINRQKVDGFDVETVVVDSGSTDGTLQIARSYGVVLVHIERNEFSFGRALNRGCDASSGEILVFISGHCIPANDSWLTCLIEPLVRGHCSYSYGRQIADDTNNFSERRVFAKYYPEQSAVPQQGIQANNANAALLRKSWLEVGFDEELTGLEDMAMAKELSKRGEKLAYTAKAVVFHHHNETWSQVRRRFEREAIALRQIAPEITLSRWDMTRCILQSTLGDIVDAARHKNWSTSPVDMFRYRYNQYLGSYKGTHQHRVLSQEAKKAFFYPEKPKKDTHDYWLKPNRRAPSNESQQPAREGQELR